MNVIIRLCSVQEIKEIGEMKKSSIGIGKVFRRTAVRIKFTDGKTLEISDDGLIGYAVESNLQIDGKEQG